MMWGPYAPRLRTKAGRYGELPHPLVVAINIGSGFHDEFDTQQALFGTVGWRLNPSDPTAEAIPVLTGEGFWGRSGLPSHRHVSGVLLAEGMHCGRVARYAPAFWPHPRPDVEVSPLGTWRLPLAGDEWSYEDPDAPPHEHFDLPMGWPIGNPFPRTAAGRRDTGAAD